MTTEKEGLKKYWLVIAQTQPIVISGQLPIYWTKKVAQEEAQTYGGTVVPVFCYWTAPKNTQS